MRSASHASTTKNKSFDVIMDPKHRQLNKAMSPITSLKPLASTRSRRTETAMTQTRQKIFGGTKNPGSDNMGDIIQHNFEKMWNIEVKKISHLEKPVIHMRYETKANRIRNEEIKRRMSPAQTPSDWKMQRFANRGGSVGSVTSSHISRPSKF